MTESSTPPDLEIEALVRRHLEREAERVDPRPLFERIEASLDGSSVTRGPVLGRRGFGWVACAAAVLIGVGSLLWLNGRPVLARAEALVRDARVTHRLPIDRCYLVEARRDSTLFDQCAPMTDQVRLTRLWTRGDRFWVESVHPRERWAWGRDGRERFWIAFGPKRALRLEPDEVPGWLDLCCDLYGLRVDEVLDSVLSKCDLEWVATPGDTPPTTWVVRATPRRGHHRRTRELVLEIDRETRVVRRMIIERLRDGRPFATVTYTLVESEPLKDDLYRLEGHLTEQTEVASLESNPGARRSLLKRWFGPEAASAFRLRDED